MKKTSFTLLSILVLVVLCLASVAGCGPEETTSSISEIFVQKTNMPRLTYVQGQDLDLSNGVLTVAMDDGTTTPVPMTDAGISTSGYDKNVLGAQTVTITYKEKTTTITVTVIPRATAENFEENYFVGDSFDSSKGRLKVTRDDGNTFTINLNSEQVTLKSFNSAAAGKVPVTVEYNDGATVVQCTFEVNVHEISEVTFTAPKKTKYTSFDTELALSGGYLTVKAPAPSTFSKYVSLDTLDDSQITGFDPSEVTIANKDTPLQQQVTINYANKTFNYTVEISYSPIHLIQDVAATLKDLDWTQEEAPEFTDTQGNDAIDAVIAYLALAPSDRALIDETTLATVLSPAVIHLQKLYFEESDEFANAFYITSDGNINIVGKTYNDIAFAIARLEDTEDEFNVYASLLYQIYEELGENTIMGQKISSMIMTHTDETVTQLVALFKYMISISDALKTVPDNWKIEDLANYADPITVAASKIMISNYAGMNYNYLYRIVSSWRTNNDYLDIIYSYYYYVMENGQADIVNKLLNKVPLPGLLNEWHVAFMTAAQQVQFMKQYESSNAYLYDTVGFMYYYSQAIECTEKIAKSEVSLYKDLYALLGCDAAMETNLRAASHGYLALMSEALDSPAVLATWEKYLELTHQFLTATEGLKFDEHGAYFEDLFHAIVALTPSELHTYLSSVNFLYDTSRGTILVLDCSTKATSTMMYLLGSYYGGTLGKDLFPSFVNLLVAMENYSLVNIKETAMEDFKTAMAALQEAYAAIANDAEKKALFDKHLGAAYTKYLAIYNNIQNPESIVVDATWESKLNELKKTLEDMDVILGVIYASETTKEEKNRLVPLFFAMYEKATAIRNELMAADDTVKTAFLTKYYTLADESKYTLEQYYFAAKNVFISFALSSALSVDEGKTSYMVWDLYGDSAIRPFLAKVADLLLTSYTKTAYTGTDVPALMAAFRALDPADQYTFFMFGVNQLYYDALDLYYSAKVDTATVDSKVLSALWSAEIYYAVYKNDPTAENLAVFVEKMDAAIAAYGSIEDTKSFDDCLGDVYTLYLNYYNQLTKSAE